MKRIHVCLLVLTACLATVQVVWADGIIVTFSQCVPVSATSPDQTCRIENVSTTTVSRVGYATVSLEDGRTLPWGEIKGEISIQGGLEPGEFVTERVRFPTLPDRARGRPVRTFIERVWAYDARGSLLLPDVPESGAGAVAPLTPGELDGLRAAIQACWNVGSLSSEALRTTVVVTFVIAPNGIPDAGTIAMESHEGGSVAAARQAYEAARRAIIRCGVSGFRLPDRDRWSLTTIRISFNPERMRVTEPGVENQP